MFADFLAAVRDGCSDRARSACLADAWPGRPHGLQAIFEHTAHAGVRLEPGAQRERDGRRCLELALRGEGRMLAPAWLLATSEGLAGWTPLPHHAEGFLDGRYPARIDVAGLPASPRAEAWARARLLADHDQRLTARDELVGDFERILPGIPEGPGSAEPAAEALAEEPLIVFSSAASGEGKSTVLLALARRLARRGPTLVVDADLRMPVLHRRLGGMLSGPGLVEFLHGERRLHIQSVAPQLDLLAAGRPESEPERLHGPLARHLRGWRERWKSVLVDTPPVGLFADGGSIAAAAEARPVLVVELGRTTRPAAVHARDALPPGTWVLPNRTDGQGRAAAPVDSELVRSVGLADRAAVCLHHPRAGSAPPRDDWHVLDIRDAPRPIARFGTLGLRELLVDVPEPTSPGTARG